MSVFTTLEQLKIELLNITGSLEGVCAENTRLKARLQEIKDRDTQQEVYYWSRGGEITKLQEENKTLREQNTDQCKLIGIRDEKITILTEQNRLGADCRDNLVTRINNFVYQRYKLQKEITHLKNQWKGQCTLVDTLNEALRKAETNVANLTQSRDDLRRNNQELITELDLVKRPRDEALDLLDRYT